jgi:hypothetical protein
MNGTIADQGRRETIVPQRYGRAACAVATFLQGRSNETDLGTWSTQCSNWCRQRFP